MAEPIVPITPGNGAEPKQPDNSGNQANVFDTSKLSDDEFKKIYDDPRLFQHSRFKELAQSKQELKELRDQQTKAQEAELVKQKEFEKLAQLKGEEATKYKTEAETAKIDAEIYRVALTKGAANVGTVKKLIDRGNIKLNEDGSITGIDEAVASLEKSDPYLFGADNKQLGNPSNPAGGGNQGVKKFKLSQLGDAKFWRENEKDIMQAMSLGLVENDQGVSLPGAR